MLSYIVGKIISINKRTITVENNYIGYVINVPKPEKFEVNKIRKLYLYKHMCTNNKNNYIEELYGFEQYESKEMFLSLININGIGPKTALNICNNDLHTVKALIQERDVQNLSVLNGITPKYARIIVDNLYDTFNNNKECENTNLGQLIQALKSLGYSNKDIEIAVKQIDPSNFKIELSDLISQSIKIIAKNQEDASIIKAN
ncbi:MAG: Holliday junction branch migration protein RuvA [Mycoplasmataceae bacterium]|jgi:Holliday junction DNA helicase RuvA|nr:Holliday junction branch migration protein RuvA [Mycoplasmataceae bacterium]